LGKLVTILGPNITGGHVSPTLLFLAPYLCLTFTVAFIKETKSNRRRSIHIGSKEKIVSNSQVVKYRPDRSVCVPLPRYVEKLDLCTVSWYSVAQIQDQI